MALITWDFATRLGSLCFEADSNARMWESFRRDAHVVEIHGISRSALLLHNHESRPHHVTHHMILSVIFDEAIHITKALLITDKSFICYWLAY